METKKAIRERITAKVGGELCSFGNKKLPQTTMILNLSSAKHCPSALLGLCHCVGVCYAKKGEGIYKNYERKNQRIRNWLLRATEDEIFETLYDWSKLNTIKTTHLRLNEPGDFHNQKEVDMWSRLAVRFENVGIKVFAWSSRADLDFSNVNFAMQGSRLDMLDNCKRVYYCVDKERFSQLVNEYGKDSRDKVAFCQCSFDKKGTCQGCNLCTDRDFKGVIYTLIH